MAASGTSHTTARPATMTSLALSFTAQPVLRELLDEFQDSSARVTIFCGAGVSVDSGLPTWRELVATLSKRIENDTLRDVIDADEATLTRRVGLILQLMPDKEQETEESATATALYASGGSFVGQLASAIARLAVTLSPRRVRLATTNFDDRLELALRAQGAAAEPLGLDDADNWFERSFTSDTFEVLHLHGYLSSSGHVRKPPVVLSEPRYLQLGSRIQAHVQHILRSSTTLFAGVSMTDPSLIGPLSDTRDDTSRKPVFTILVPEAKAPYAQGEPANRAAHAYTILQRDYLRDQLNAKPVVLKSYAQVAQLMLEYAIGIRQPAEFNSDDPATSLRYGFRFQRVLRRIHEAVHVTEGRYGPDAEHALVLSDELRDALREPIDYINDHVARVTYEVYEELGMLKHNLQSEQFALFMWLRAMREQHDRSPCPYKILQVGSSAYSQRSGRLSTKYHSVTANAQFAAPQCVYFGRSKALILELDVEERPDDPTWRSFIATPLICTEADVGVGTESTHALTVGAMALHSSRRIVEPEKLEKAYAAWGDVERRYRPSAMSLMDTEQLEELFNTIAEAGKSVLRRMTQNTGPPVP